jgi:hypothetical protein
MRPVTVDNPLIQLSRGDRDLKAAKYTSAFGHHIVLEATKGYEADDAHCLIFPKTVTVTTVTIVT